MMLVFQQLNKSEMGAKNGGCAIAMFNLNQMYPYSATLLLQF